MNPQSTTTPTSTPNTPPPSSPTPTPTPTPPPAAPTPNPTLKNPAPNTPINYHSFRAIKARLSRRLNHTPIKLLLIFILIALLAGGTALLLMKNPLAWLTLSLAALPLTLLIWIKYDLTHLPPGPTNTVTDLLSLHCLSLMPPHPTTTDLAQLILKTDSGQFLALRFGIAPDLILQIAKLQDSDPTPIFQAALALAHQTATLQAQQQTSPDLTAETQSPPHHSTSQPNNPQTIQPKINGATLLAALIATFPDQDTLLNSLKIDFTDLQQGIIWFNRLHGLATDATKPRHHGGFARDFMFGYTPLLDHFGQNISKQRENLTTTATPVPSHQAVLSQLVKIFTSQGRQNAALIGPYGSGRSTIIDAFADLLLDSYSPLPSSLKYRQIFALDAAAILSAANSNDNNAPNLEALVTQLLGEAYAAKNIIICLDNAHLFFEQATGSVDLSNLLLPILEAGNLRIILTMDQQKFLEISAKNAALTNTLNKITLTPTNETETLSIMQDRIPLLEYSSHVIYTYQSIRQAYRLSQRYIHDLEMPGRALALLESAAKFTTNKFVTPATIQQTIENTQGIKLQADTANTTERDKLLHLEDLIHQRMIDQEHAVATVSNALRRSAAGVRNENHPIGTFLFLGPTGVGKTELAKALSEVYFNGEKHLIRLDLNEFVTEADVARLLADGADNPLSLTAQVMKQPFSVVLLDEIEKAHPKVLTTLLQLLDEGILRDLKNHEVSFRDTIVIATSNAGADRIRTYVEQTQQPINSTTPNSTDSDQSANPTSNQPPVSNHPTFDQFKDQFINDLISSNQFRPEFLNRFDEICLFQPLDKPHLLQVIDLILTSVNQTLAPQKITVSLDDEAKLLLVDRGYDPRLGARPMRRIVQQAVENYVATAVLSGAATPGSHLTITKDQISL